MGKPYSLDLRERIFNYIAAGHSRRDAARVFGVSPSTAVRLAASHRDRGSIAPKPQGRAPGTAGKWAHGFPDQDGAYRAGHHASGVGRSFGRDAWCISRSFVDTSSAGSIWVVI